jgi:hypothetical protein
MATLTGKQIANSYKQLLQIGTDNSGIVSTLQDVQDGAGNNAPLQLSNSTVNINGTLQLNGSALTADASALNAITDLTGITGLVAMNGGTALGRTLTAGTGITIGNANGTAGNPTIAVSLDDTTINVAKVSASVATFNSIVSAAFFVGDGSGLTNVPSAEGGTMKQVDAGTGIKMTVGGAVSSSIPVSGVIAVSADQNFGTVSVSTAFVATGSAVFGTLSATNIDADELLIAGVSAANVTQVAAVSALTSVNTAAVTSINTVVANVSALTSVNTAAVTSINTVVAGVSALTKTNLDSITSINTVVAGVSALTSVNTAAVTSINTVIAAVSALTSVNTAAVTSINTVVAAVSALTKTNLDSITSINTVVAGVSALTSVNTAAVTSINTVITDLSATMATSINNRTGAITSINTVITNLSATLATSIGNRLALTGGTLTGIVSGTDFYVSAVAVGTNSLLGKDIHIEKAAVADIQTLTDGTNISVDLNAGQNFTVTLAGNRTLDNPTNCVAGQVGSIFVVQDGTGSRTLAYGTSWDFPAGEAPVLSTDADAIDRIDYIVHTSTDVHAVLTKAYS